MASLLTTSPSAECGRSIPNSKFSNSSKMLQIKNLARKHLCGLKNGQRGIHSGSKHGKSSLLVCVPLDWPMPSFPCVSLSLLSFNSIEFNVVFLHSSQELIHGCFDFWQRGQNMILLLEKLPVLPLLVYSVSFVILGLFPCLHSEKKYHSTTAHSGWRSTRIKTKREEWDSYKKRKGQTRTHRTTIKVSLSTRIDVSQNKYIFKRDDEWVLFWVFSLLDRKSEQSFSE